MKGEEKSIFSFKRTQKTLKYLDGEAWKFSRKFMSSLSDQSSVFQRFLAPLRPFLASANHQRRCHKVSDQEWVKLGLERVVGDHRSGCAFVQDRVLRNLFEVNKSHYFESCKSERRYQHLSGVVKDFTQHHAQISLKENNLFPTCERANKALKGLHLYAGDGHFHSASSHDQRDHKGAKNAVGHLYALNLRNQFLSHLSLGSDGSSKKPHDMGVLKKLDAETLRQGAKKGEKTLYIWDRAGIDFRQWDKWKMINAVYFLSRVKENMKLGSPAPQGFDRDDPINQGVLRDDFVTNSCGTMIRRVRFLIPETNEEIEFITNLGKVVPPGLIAQLYFTRWRIEKSFDELKNKLYESKAWAMSPNAKRMQAAFIILAYNLAQLLHNKIEEPGDQEKRPIDPPNAKKKEKRLQELKSKAEGHIKQLPLLREIYQKPSQLSAKFYRWLRVHLHNEAPWAAAQQRLIAIYERF